MLKIFFEWITNKSPFWAAYCGFMSGCLIKLYKQPGVCLFGVGETWRRIFDKCMLRFMGPESTNACQCDQLCARRMTGFDGAVYRVQDIWENKLTIEYWGLLLVDAKNAFNYTN